MASTSGTAALPATDAGEPPSGRLRWSRRCLAALVGVVRTSVGGRWPSDGCAAPPSRSLPPSPWVERRCERGAGSFGSGVDPQPPRPAPLAKPLTVAHYRTMARQVAYERQVALLDARDVARDVWFAGSTPSPAGAQGRG